mmetsp:Transcript_5287/g.16679  ORF Transcript_5287/g.16679 Transcript_5287/m.16679 type:complete len:227 (-) Transcript_5287:126-806(-)
MPSRPRFAASAATARQPASSCTYATKKALWSGDFCFIASHKSGENEIHVKRWSRPAGAAPAAAQASASTSAADAPSGALSSAKQIFCRSSARPMISSTRGGASPFPTSASATAASSSQPTGHALKNSDASPLRFGNVAVRQSVASWSVTRLPLRSCWRSHSKPSLRAQASVKAAIVFSGERAEAPRCPTNNIVRTGLSARLATSLAGPASAVVASGCCVGVSTLYT